ncbi:tetratricopeptide repeat protein [Candidatus Thiosymbion oneisti]|uniref:tetratricopeptide repeat protein n=1 Tax=Candidatus Thiosymbion oneisti TaxID=589554 RepID=UPI000B7E969F|nr:tetratricopeptide repeat protein [Candidatus Thiosymbion oneisti]
MQKVFELSKNFIPLLLQYPKWVQVFFFAVVFQILFLAFVLVIYYFLSLKSFQKQRTTIVTQPQNVKEGLPKSEKRNQVPKADKQKTDLGIDKELKIDEKYLESNDPRIALTLSNLAAMYEAQGRYKDAEEILLKVLKIQERAFGKKHPNYATTLNNISSLYTRSGKYEEAEKVQLEALNIVEASYGKMHPATATFLNNLAFIYLKLARYNEAAPLIERAITIRTSTLGPDHPELISPLENLLEIFQKAGDQRKVNELSNKIQQLKKKFKH